MPALSVGYAQTYYHFLPVLSISVHMINNRWYQAMLGQISLNNAYELKVLQCGKNTPIIIKLRWLFSNLVAHNRVIFAIYFLNVIVLHRNFANLFAKTQCFVDIIYWRQNIYIQFYSVCTIFTQSLRRHYKYSHVIIIQCKALGVFGDMVQKRIKYCYVCTDTFSSDSKLTI